jgi:putative flippase GtrA
MIFKKYPILRFGSTAAIVFTVDFALLFVFHSILEIELRLSVVLAFLFAFVINFSMNNFWVFKNQDSKRSSLIRFTLLVLFNLLVQASLIPTLVALGLNYLVAKIIVVFALFAVNYTVSKKYVFTSFDN